jgi:hypothetical protein
MEAKYNGFLGRDEITELDAQLESDLGSYSIKL